MNFIPGINCPVCGVASNEDDTVCWRCLAPLREALDNNHYFCRCKHRSGRRRRRRWRRNLDPNRLLALRYRRNLDPDRLLAFRYRRNLDPDRLLAFRRRRHFWRRNPTVTCGNCGTGNREGKDLCWKCGFDLAATRGQRLANIRRRAPRRTVF